MPAVNPVYAPPARRALPPAVDSGKITQGPRQWLGISTATWCIFSETPRMAFGFKDTDALISLAMLALGGYRPDLPGRES